MTQLADFGSFCEALSVELDLPSLVELPPLLEDDVALDSLLRFEILLLVEEWIGVTLPDALIAHLQTLEDFHDIFCTRGSRRDP